jgi:hypothetical protein
MEKSPSCSANQFSASQEIPRILWNPKVHYRVEKSPPPDLITNQIMSYRKISLGSRHMYPFRNKANFYGEELMAIRPTPKSENHPLSAYATAYSIYPQLPCILEAVPPSETWGRCDRNPLIMEWF